MRKRYNNIYMKKYYIENSMKKIKRDIEDWFEKKVNRIKQKDLTKYEIEVIIEENNQDNVDGLIIKYELINRKEV